MTILILGLLLFLGTHSVRIVAEDWRARQIARLGLGHWKLLYSAIAVATLALVVWGYGMTRVDPIVVWNPPAWTRHAAALLTLPAFVLIAAAYVPGNRIKAALHHPMILGIKVWALAHLIANGRLGDVVLFGSFLVWAILDFKAARTRDLAAGTRYAAGSLRQDAIAIALGLALWAAIAFWLHAWITGVRPFG